MEHKRIIIADDEALIRQDLREMLTNLGYLVIGDVGDGRSAVNLARELKPDLVIMDIRMPDMDGIEAAKILTEEGIAPVLLLSAYSQRDRWNAWPRQAFRAMSSSPLTSPTCFRQSRSCWRASASIRRYPKKLPGSRNGSKRALPSTVPRASSSITVVLPSKRLFETFSE